MHLSFILESSPSSSPRFTSNSFPYVKKDSNLSNFSTDSTTYVEEDKYSKIETEIMDDVSSEERNINLSSMYAVVDKTRNNTNGLDNDDNKKEISNKESFEAIIQPVVSNVDRSFNVRASIDSNGDQDYPHVSWDKDQIIISSEKVKIQNDSDDRDYTSDDYAVVDMQMKHSNKINVNNTYTTVHTSQETNKTNESEIVNNSQPMYDGGYSVITGW